MSSSHSTRNDKKSNPQMPRHLLPLAETAIARRWWPQLTIPPDYLKVISPRACLLLAAINYLVDDNTTKDGWIRCSIKDIRNIIPKFDRSTQITLLRELKCLGVMEVKKQGSPGTRHARIDFVRIEVLIATHEKRSEVDDE